jgi:hypothetical protein
MALDQPPLATQDVAFVELHVNVVFCPEVTESGLAEIEAVGKAITVTEADFVVSPPSFEHVIE